MDNMDELESLPKAFERYVELMLGEEQSQPIDMTNLIEDAVAAAKEKKEGEVFSVSSLLPAETWARLNRAQKQVIAITIREIAETA